MKLSDVENLSNAYNQILKEDVGLGGSSMDAGQGAISMGVGMPDNGAHNDKSIRVKAISTELSSSLEQAVGILVDLKSNKDVPPWILPKLATVEDLLQSVHKHISIQDSK